MTIAVGFGSETFEFKSKYPLLHMPAYPVSDRDLVNPNSGIGFLDGEFALLDGATRKLRRPEGADLAVSAVQLRLHHVHANPGRSDVQFGQVPFVMDDGYEFISRLHTGNQTGGGGVAVAEGDRMKVVLQSVDINGVTYAGRAVLEATTTGGDYFVCVCLVPPDADGWARFRRISGLV